MSGNDVVEAEGLGHVVDELAAGKHFRNRLGGTRPLLGAHFVDQKELHRDGVLEQERKGHGNFRGAAAVDRNDAVGRQDLRQKLCVRREINLDHRIDAAARGDCLGSLSDALALVVDHVIGACLPRHVCLGR